MTHSQGLLGGLLLDVGGTLEIQRDPNAAVDGLIDVDGKGLLGGGGDPNSSGQTFDPNGQVVPGATKGVNTGAGAS